VHSCLSGVHSCCRECTADNSQRSLTDIAREQCHLTPPKTDVIVSWSRPIVVDGNNKPQQTRSQTRNDTISTRRCVAFQATHEQTNGQTNKQTEGHHHRVMTPLALRAGSDLILSNWTPRTSQCNTTENNGRTTWSNNYQKRIQCTLSPLLSILTPIHHLSAPPYRQLRQIAVAQLLLVNALLRTNIVTILCVMSCALKFVS